MASSTRLGKPSQEVHDLLNFRGEPLKSENHLLALQRTSLAERYVKSDLSVILELAPKRNDLPVEVGLGKRDEIAVNRPVFVLQFHAINRNHSNHWNQEMVFVAHVEGVKSADINVPSFVRFHNINQESEELRTGRYLSCLFELGFKMLPIVAHNELSLGGIESRRADGLDGFPIGNIQSALEIVNCVTDNQCEIGAQFSVSKSVVEELFPRLSVDVQSGAVSIRRDPQSLVDIRDVLIGPFDF